MHEIVPFEEERLSRRDRECVREAVAVIQACPMPALSKAAECAARQFAVFGVDWYELDAGPADEVIQVAQTFGTVSRLDDDGDLDERSDGHQASIGRLDGFDEGTPFGFALQNGDKRRRIDDHLARQPVLVVAENLVIRTRVEHGSLSTPPDELVQTDSLTPSALAGPHARQALLERAAGGHRNGFTRLGRQLSGEPIRLGVLDVQRHRSILYGRKVDRQEDGGSRVGVLGVCCVHP